MQKVDVVYRYAADGRVIPEQVQLDGVTWFVAGYGRRWTSEDGEHMLVQVGEGEVLHLLYKPETGDWYLLPRFAPGVM